MADYAYAHSLIPDAPPFVVDRLCVCMDCEFMTDEGRCSQMEGNCFITGYVQGTCSPDPKCPLDKWAC